MIMSQSSDQTESIAFRLVIDDEYCIALGGRYDKLVDSRLQYILNTIPILNNPNSLPITISGDFTRGRASAVPSPVIPVTTIGRRHSATEIGKRREIVGVFFERVAYALSQVKHFGRMSKSSVLLSSRKSNRKCQINVQPTTS